MINLKKIKQENKEKAITAKITSEDFNSLEKISKSARVNRSMIIRELIKEFIRKNGKKK
jgi:metal-responsive CopG/Arc/MetJ family transcriptional regulator